MTHTRGQLSWASLPPTPLFQGSWDLFSVPLHELQTKSQASPCAESFFKRLINLLGMSQERWAISLEENIFMDGCVWLHLYACVCVLICVHCTSIKTQPRLQGSCVVNILGSKQVTSELLKLVSYHAGSGNEPHFSSRRIKSRKDRDRNQKYYKPSPMENNVDSSMPILNTCSNLLYYYFVCFIHLCPLYF